MVVSIIKYTKYLLISICLFVLAFGAVFLMSNNTVVALANVKQMVAKNYNIDETIEGIIKWKKSTVGSLADEPLFNDRFLSQAGTTDGDWHPIGMGRYGYADDYDAYLAVITDYVSKKYNDKDKLDKVKATEWHRISLAITALGGDPTNAGEGINLIADGTYNRGEAVSPGRQGINGWIWSLIAIDSKRYEVPDDAFHTRQDFIVEILKAQLSDGGFALSGAIADPDITAMAVQALAPYYNSELAYEYTSTKIQEKDENGKIVTDDKGNPIFIRAKKTVRNVVNECISLLSALQNDDGDFSSWGMKNAESTCQVIVALTSLGINPLTDTRFIKNGNTLLDGIMRYRLDNGGFLHSFVYDSDNPTSKPNEANAMASDQTLYALASLWRQQEGMRTLYDMRSEFNAEERAEIDEVIIDISKLNNNSLKSEVEGAFQKYEKINLLNRSYVTNYWTLSSQMARVAIAIPEEDPDYDDNESGSAEILTYFTMSDVEKVYALPPTKELTTEYYVTVIKLFNKLKNAENKDEYISLYATLEKGYNQIGAIQAEIDAINAEIQNKLHPFDSIGIDDKRTINEIVNRYNMLSAFDKTKITHYEDLIKSKTQVDNITTAIIISCVCGVAAVVIAIFTILHIRKRKKLKLSQTMLESEE